MNEIEEMPIAVLLDAWYLTYGSEEVHFPLFRNPSRAALVVFDEPIKTRMWQNRYATMGMVGAPTDTTRRRFVEYYGKNREWALHTHMIGTAIAAVKVRYKGV